MLRTKNYEHKILKKKIKKLTDDHMDARLSDVNPIKDKYLDLVDFNYEIVFIEFQNKSKEMGAESDNLYP